MGTVIGSSFLPSPLAKPASVQMSAATIVDSFEETEVISQISTLKSFWGLNIPLSSGTRMITGVPLWIGKKSGNNISFAVGLGYRTAPIQSGSNPKCIVSKIWANDELIMDRTGAGELVARGIKFTVYSGTETQTPDPTIVAAEGAENTPAFRGMIYLVFHDLDLAQFDFFEPPVIRVEFTERESYQPLVECFQSGPAMQLALQENYPATGTGKSWSIGDVVVANRAGRLYFLLSRFTGSVKSPGYISPYGDGNSFNGWINIIVCHDLKTGAHLFDAPLLHRDNTAFGEEISTIQYLTGLNLLIVVGSANIYGRVYIVDPTIMKVIEAAGYSTAYPYTYSFYPRLVTFYDDGEASKIYDECPDIPPDIDIALGGSYPQAYKVQYHQIMLYPEDSFGGTEVNVLTIGKILSNGLVAFRGMSTFAVDFATNPQYAPKIGRYHVDALGTKVSSGVATSDWSFVFGDRRRAYLAMTTQYTNPSSNAAVEALPILTQYPQYVEGDSNSGIWCHSYDPSSGKMRVIDRGTVLSVGETYWSDVALWDFKIKESYGIPYNFRGEVGVTQLNRINFTRTVPTLGSFITDDAGSSQFNELYVSRGVSDTSWNTFVWLYGTFNSTSAVQLNEADVFAPVKAIDGVASPFIPLDTTKTLDDYKTTWPYYVAGTNLIYQPSWDSKNSVAYDVKLGYGLIKIYPFGGSGALNLADFLKWISLRAGFASSDIIVSGIDDVVWGSIINADVDFWTLVSDLSKVYDFDVFESEGKIKFVRNLDLASPVIDYSVTTDELAPITATTFQSDGSEPSLKISRIGESSLPSEVRVNYIDYLQSYRVSSSVARRMQFPKKLTQSDTVYEYSVPICMNPSEGLTKATRILYDSWADRTTYELRMPIANVLIEPGSYITVEESLPLELTTLITTHVIKIATVTTNADWSVSLGGKAFYAKERVELNVAAPTRDTPIISGPSQGELILFDVPMLDPANADLTTALVSIPLVFINTTVGTMSYVDSYGVGTDSSETYIGRNSGDTAYGYLQQELAANLAPYSIDEQTTISFSLIKGDPSLIVPQSYDDFLAGKNFIAIGKAGSWEIISYRDVVVEGRRVTINGLIRGLRGTENNTIHTSGDYIIMSQELSLFNLSSSPYSLPASMSVKNLGYKQSEYEATFSTFTINANYEKPFAPNNLAAVYEGSDVRLSWNRRTREHSTITNGSATTPFLKESDTYSVVIYNAESMEVRVMEGVVGQNFLYTEAMRIADGNTSNVLRFTVSQLCTMAGIGYGFWAPSALLDIR